MRFEASQHMKLGQSMKLAPRMIQSMEILQLAQAELEERIAQELEGNMTLELAEPTAEPRADGEAREPAPETPDRPLEIDEASGREDFERLDSFEGENPEAFEPPEPRARELDADRSYERQRLAGERDGKQEAMANAPARSDSLGDQLQAQWEVADVEDRLKPLGRQIIANLDDDGLLRTPLAGIADRAPADQGPAPSPEDWERALQAVQLWLEPAGIGARDLRECLLLQMDAQLAESADPERELARTLIDQHLDDIAQNRLPKIAGKIGIPVERVKSAIERLRGLSTAPGRRLVDEPNASIVPDAIIEYDEPQDRYVAYLNDSRLPNLQINKQYAEMVRDRDLSKKDREFIKTNLGNAQWLIDAVRQRNHTLLRVINVVADAQREYFDFGPQALKPLPMTQVAEQLGIHVATVSRAVAGKHVFTPRGVVALRKFFTGGMQTDSGEEMSYDAIKAALKEAIDAEDKAAPLSDEALAEELKKRGIEIARRTIAKYRDQLGIPSARLRKTF